MCCRPVGRPTCSGHPHLDTIFCPPHSLEPLPKLSSFLLCLMPLSPALSWSACPWGSSSQALELPGGLLKTQIVGSCGRALLRAPMCCWRCWSGDHALRLTAPAAPVRDFGRPKLRPQLSSCSGECPLSSHEARGCSCISKESARMNCRWSQMGPGLQTPLPGCVTLGKWLDLSGPLQMSYGEASVRHSGCSERRTPCSPAPERWRGCTLRGDQPL